MSDIDQIILELKCLGEVAEVEGVTVEGNELHPIINAAWEAIATLKEQNALLTVQVQGLRDALEDLLEQFDPRNHQSNCECDPSVGYQCAACKFPSIPAVGAAHDAITALPQQE